MGRQGDPAVHSSSIALLQERFRRLQRAKEMRKEREVLRLFSEAERMNPPTPHEASSSQSFFHSELILQPRPPPQGSLYSESSMMQTMHTRRQVIETPRLSNLQPSDTFNDSDVDTSLHL